MAKQDKTPGEAQAGCHISFLSLGFAVPCLAAAIWCRRALLNLPLRFAPTRLSALHSRDVRRFSAGEAASL